MVILVTGVGGASGLCTAMALKDKHSVVVCDSNKFATGLYMEMNSFIAPLAKNEIAFEIFIKTVIAAMKVDVIFPNVDEELLIFAKYEFPCQVIISPYETIDICNDKSKTMLALKEVIPIPFAKGPPFFVKPRFGRGSRNIHKVNNFEELFAILNYLDLKGINSTIQDYLPGKEYTVDALFDQEGNLVVAVPRERLGISGGVSVTGRTVQHSLLIHYVEKISKKLSFFGPINFQFKEDQKGQPKLIEINPRCSGGLAITIQSGVNIPELALEKNIQEDMLQWEETLVIRYLTQL